MVTTEQIAALKYLIGRAKVKSDMAQRILFFLIEQSNGLTEEVAFTLFENHGGFTAQEVNEAAFSLGALSSSRCTTHLNELTKLMGTDMEFNFHYGHYDDSGEFNTEGQFPTHKKSGHVRYTFWMFKSNYADRGKPKKLVAPSKEELMAINLYKPGLYPSLERDR